MPLRINETANRFIGQSVWHVLHPLPTFVLDDLPLRVEFLLVQIARKKRHPLGLHVKRSLHIFIGNRLEVDCHVFAGKRVGRPTRLL